MIEIVPNWHPIWIHFAIALLITAAGVYLLFGWRSERSGEGPPAALIVSRWLLWLGTLAALAALLTGFWASNSVQHDDLGHANMLVHRNWAIASVVLFGIVALVEFWRRNRTRASVISALLLLAGSAAIAKTGLEGGENVFEHGLGVQRLPQVTEAGHEHGGHDHGGPEAEQQLESAGEEPAAGHQHEHADTAHESDTPPDPVADDGDHPAARVASELNQALASGDAEGVRSLMAGDCRFSNPVTSRRRWKNTAATTCRQTWPSWVRWTARLSAARLSRTATWRPCSRATGCRVVSGTRTSIR
jgi:uncharacterized membrane protein